MKRSHKRMKGCPFCDSGIEEIAFLQSDNFLVVYNNSPILPGHSLVIPKDHIESLLDLTDAEQFEFIHFSIQAARVILKVFQAESFNWTIQEKPAAGQTIPHLHLHIFPRHENDLPSPEDWYPILKKSVENQSIDSEQRPRLKRNEIIEIVNQIKIRMNR